MSIQTLAMKHTTHACVYSLEFEKMDVRFWKLGVSFLQYR